jgi:hypothetical protein
MLFAVACIRLVEPLLFGLGERYKGKALQPFRYKGLCVFEVFRADPPSRILYGLVPTVLAAGAGLPFGAVAEGHEVGRRIAAFCQPARPEMA